MDVRIDPTGTPALDGADDFTSLRLIGTRPSSAAARSTLGASGIELTDDDGHGYIEPAAIARLAGAAADGPGWQEGFQRMVDYAVGKGWSDDAGRLRAHAEWQDGAPDSIGYGHDERAPGGRP
jgi:hypothetical protein